MSHLQGSNGNGWVAFNGSDLVIGKDVLELLSSSMYVDTFSIYREVPPERGGRYRRGAPTRAAG